MRQAFVNWLPEYLYIRFMVKQLIIVGCALILTLFSHIPFPYALLIIGSLILIFCFLLNAPSNDIQSTTRHPKQELPSKLANPHGVLNHAIVVGVSPIILGSILSFFI